MALARELISSEKKLTETNKAQPLTSESLIITAVSVKAKKGNAAVLYIGPATINATGYPLEPNESLEFDFLDMSQIFIYGKENDGVNFAGLRPE